MEAASLYNHIQSKQAILQELLLNIADEFTSGMANIDCRDIEAIAKLEALIALHVDLTIQYTDAISLIPKEWIHLEGEAIKNFLTSRDNYEKSFRHILATAINENSLKKMDVDIALFTILSTLRWLYSWYSRNNTIDPDTLKTSMIQSLLYGLASR